jgi:hypothetical protein
MNELLLDTTKSGKAALWESGGGKTNTGEAVLITGRKGERVRPYFLRYQGRLACDNHALMPVVPGSYIIQASRYYDSTKLTIKRVVRIEKRVEEPHVCLLEISKASVQELSRYFNVEQELDKLSKGEVMYQFGGSTLLSTRNDAPVGALLTRSPNTGNVCWKYDQSSVDRQVAILETICTQINGVWDKIPEDFLIQAVKAAQQKCCDYHCKTPYYVLSDTDVQQPTTEQKNSKREHVKRNLLFGRDRRRSTSAKVDGVAQGGHAFSASLVYN